MHASIERLVRYAVAAMAGMLVASASAEDFGELEGSEHSPTFTAAERKLFVDAVSRFRTHQIPVRYFNGGVYWLDDEHLVFSSREYPGWKAQADEPSHIVIYNVVSGEIRDSGYRGRLDCLNHLGDFMLRLSTVSEELSFKPENFRWFIGRWGQPAQEIEYDRWAHTPDYLCRSKPRRDPTYQPILGESPPHVTLLTPLLPEHGALRETVFKEGGRPTGYTYLIKPDGTNVFVRNSLIMVHALVFQPWNNTYFENGTTSREPTTITLKGENPSHAMPRLIRFWSGRNVGRGGAFGCRYGVLWTIKKSRGLWKKQGMYLDTGNELLRVNDVSVVDQVMPSPNGCKVFFGAYPGDYFKLKKNWQASVIDLCEGLSK